MADNLIFARTVINDAANPWLVMVHGFVQNHKAFRYQEEVFAGRFNLLLVDMRGHGGSAHIGPPYGPEEYADDLEALLSHHGIGRFYYWGTHTGTGVGMITALRNHGRVLGLVLEGCVLPGFPMPRVDELIAMARKTSREKGVEAAKEEWFEQADWYAYMASRREACRAEEHKRIVREFGGKPWMAEPSARQATNVDSRLEELRMPMLLYNGEEDMPDFFRVAERIKSRIPASAHSIIPHAGGFPGWENPQVVNQAVNNFLLRLTQR